MVVSLCFFNRHYTNVLYISIYIIIENKMLPEEEERKKKKLEWHVMIG